MIVWDLIDNMIMRSVWSPSLIRGSVWEFSRLPMPEWVGQTPSTLLSCSSRRAPPACLSWSAPPTPLPSECPQDPRSLVEALEWEEPAWKLSRLPGLSGPGDCPPPFSSSSPRDPPTCLSWSPWPQGCRSCLASTSLPSSVPLRPTGSLWGSSRLLGR